jgi:hypothetical protein
MKVWNILGVGIFSVGFLTLIGFGLAEFLKDLTIPIAVKWAIIAIFLGIIIILISLIRERIKEKKS